MEKLADMLVELRVALTEILENSGTESNALPQIEAPSSSSLEDQYEDIESVGE
jgi:hypothetical protein